MNKPSIKMKLFAFIWLVLACMKPSIGVEIDQPTPQDYIVYRGPAHYPEHARKQGIEGEVTVSVTVSQAGSVTHVSIVESKPPGVFDESVTTAAKEWKFVPKCGKSFSTEFKTRSSYIFALSQSDTRTANIVAPAAMTVKKPVEQNSDGIFIRGAENECKNAGRE